MGLVSYVSRGIHAAKELINHDPKDKSFLKAKPEVFDWGEKNTIHRLIGILNKKEDEKTVYDKNSVPIEIDKMLNKSKEHLYCFLLKAQKTEASCSYLIERSQCDFVGGIAKERPETRLELVNFMKKYVVNEIIKRANLACENENSSHSRFINYGGLIIKGLEENISKLGESNEKIKLLTSGNGDEHISTDLTDYVNKHASYSVEPEIFYPLIIKYYESKAESLCLPSMEELDTLINSVVKKIEDIKLLYDSEVAILLSNSAGGHTASHFHKLV
ncbi:hypothetical protein ACKEVG_02365 [Yersinia enterocolitica]